MSLFIVAGIITVSASFAQQEHPKEHPTDKKDHSQEHPSEHPSEHPKEHPSEHPAESLRTVEAVPVTKENLAVAIRQIIADASAENKGLFLALDELKGKSLELKLKKVHDDKLASLGNQTYFACADFQTAEGKVYDLDIFMEGPDADGLKMTEVSVHKEDGVERYTWMEKEGIWKKIEAVQK
jgi:ABC-type Zn2+ transport system substrate-binding protein/surface adhesin